jgi:hypothetical protein
MNRKTWEIIYGWIFIFFFTVPLSVSADEAISLDEKSRLEVGLILQMHSKIEQEVKNKQLLVKTKDLCSEGEAQGQKSIYLDKNGSVREFSWAGGDGDMYEETDFYYDEKGSLRFVASFSNSIYGKHDEEKVFLNENREVLKSIWEHSIINKEAGVNEHEEKVSKTPRETPDYVWDPKKEFSKKEKCE